MNKAFYISKYGGPKVMEWGEFPPAPLGPKDVRIQVHAASVNPLDWRIRDGALKVLLPYAFPLILGSDCSGIVSEVGQQVSRFKVGDAVYSRIQKGRNGTFAQETVTDEATVAHKPAALSHVEAASLPLVLLTAFQLLTEAAPLQTGQWVLIHAGAGAVGNVSLQLAKHLRLRTATTVSQGSVALVQALGADFIIDRNAQRFEDEVEGMDAVIDSVGMANLLRSFACVKPGGTVVSIADGADVAIARQFHVNRLLWPVFWALGARPHAAAKRVGATYRFWFMRPDGAQLESLNPLLEDGTIRPCIDRVFAFDETRQAVAWAEGGKAKGKVVIQMQAAT